MEFPDFPTAGRLALRLEAAGIDAASVTDVVLTPMHMDHVGGLPHGGMTMSAQQQQALGDGLGSRLRPDLRVHVAAGDAVFQVAFDHPDWFNGFEHDPEEAARVRVSLLRELAATREALVATHLPFPSVCHVAVAGNAFRGVPAVWDY